MGELFAGIGGFSLGFRRAGFDVKWQVEIDPYCRKVLEKNFPEAERFEDVRTVGKHNLAPVDVICGGFPCQDISQAGPKAGIDGERSGLVTHAIRATSELRPRYLVLENVAALLIRGMGRVVGMLADIGYDAEWRMLSARQFGANNLRRRVFIVAYPQRKGLSGRNQGPRIFGSASTPFPKPCHSAFGEWSDMDAAIARLLPVDRLSVGMVRKPIKALGNAVVPQIPEWIAKRILQAEAAS